MQASSSGNPVSFCTQGAADDGKSQVSRSFPIFKAFLKGLLEVVCRKEVNGDVGRAFKALKQANKMVGELRDDGEVGESNGDTGGTRESDTEESRGEKRERVPMWLSLLCPLTRLFVLFT